MIGSSAGSRAVSFVVAVLLAALTATGYLAVSEPRPVAAEATATTADPVLYTSPSCLSEETSIVISGRNFTPNQSIDVWDM